MEEERINILKFVKHKVKNLGEDFPGLQSDPNLHTFEEFKIFIEKIKKYLKNYRIYRCWANYSCGDYINFHNHPKPVVKSLVYFLENKNNLGPIFLEKRGSFLRVNMLECPENSLLIFDGNKDHSVPCHLKEDRYSIALDLII